MDLIFAGFTINDTQHKFDHNLSCMTCTSVSKSTFYLFQCFTISQ